MNKLFTLIIIFCVTSMSVFSQTRYVDEVFTDVDVQTDVVYGVNYTILFFPVLGKSVPQELKADIYTPQGDTQDARPMIFVYHTGNFLPRLLNAQINGEKTDPYVVDMCTRLAKRGFVVASVDYRQGWDPQNPSQERRINTLINAAYRGVQDANSAVRFFRKSAIDDGNPYGIDPDKFANWGVGTGSYITYAQSTLDEYLDIVLLKFIGSDINGDGIPDPMVIEPINGDLYGETILGQNPQNGDTLAIPNTPGYSSEIQFSVQMGGAMGDTSWLDAGDPPLVSFHVPNDPFAPYNEGILIVPTTGDQIVEVQGANLIIQRANALGNNDILRAGIYNDPYTDRANEINGGNEGLFPFHRPTWDLDMDGTPETDESSPWDWWDPVVWSTAPFGQATLDGMGEPCEGIPMEFCNWDIISRANNPDMTFEKADAYIDTIMNYFAPRACLALNLPECAQLFSNTEDLIDDSSLVSISPNPASDQVIVKSEGENILKLEVVDIEGRLVFSQKEINAEYYEFQRKDLKDGIYLFKTYFEKGVLTKKVIFQN